MDDTKEQLRSVRTFSVRMIGSHGGQPGPNRAQSARSLRYQAGRSKYQARSLLATKLRGCRYLDGCRLQRQYALSATPSVSGSRIAYVSTGHAVGSA
eukprot:3941952-Rhodomonas_salina.6